MMAGGDYYGEPGVQERGRGDNGSVSSRSSNAKSVSTSGGHTAERSVTSRQSRLDTLRITDTDIRTLVRKAKMMLDSAMQQ